MTKLYVGNLPYSFDDAKLAEVFSKFGTVLSAVVIKDRETRRSKGFGFVEFESEEAAKKAIQEMDGADIDGRNLKVNEARPQQPR